MNESFRSLLEHAGAVRAGLSCGRYAPSPSGELHLGNLRTALMAWLQARLAGGVFILRMEDLDRPRNRAGCAEKILCDLRRLGLDWDEGPDLGGPLGPYTQRERTGLYEAAFQQLEESGRVFSCFCSRKDIRDAPSAPHGVAPVYPGTCRPSSPSRGNPIPARTGPAPAWRFAVGDAEIRFHDCLAGMYRQDLGRDIGDFVVKRRDDVFAYQLAVVVDDALMGVSDVLRGEDLIDSTPRQIALQGALDLPTPRYWHVPMVRDERGRRLSKRDGSASLDEYLATGGTVESLVGRFASDLRLVEPGLAVTARELLGGLRVIDLFRSVCLAGRP